MKLLLVEDESKLVDSLSHLLRKNGFVVDTALDGQTGLEMACTDIYDIIAVSYTHLHRPKQKTGFRRQNATGACFLLLYS